MVGTEPNSFAHGGHTFDVHHINETDSRYYTSKIEGHDIVIIKSNDHGGDWIAVIDNEDIEQSANQYSHMVFDYVVNKAWLSLIPRSDSFIGFVENDWYYNNQLVFEHYRGNQGRTYLGEVKGKDVRVIYIPNYAIWKAFVGENPIPHCYNVKADNVLRFIVEKWDGIVR